MNRRAFLGAAGLVACGAWALAAPPPERGRKPKPTTTTTTTLPPGGGYADAYADAY